jgi:hypothetical protein
LEYIPFSKIREEKLLMKKWVLICYCGNVSIVVSHKSLSFVSHSGLDPESRKTETGYRIKCGMTYQPKVKKRWTPYTMKAN